MRAFGVSRRQDGPLWSALIAAMLLLIYLRRLRSAAFDSGEAHWHCGKLTTSFRLDKYTDRTAWLPLPGASAEATSLLNNVRQPLRKHSIARASVHAAV